jgi:hypothetical protein
MKTLHLSLKTQYFNEIKAGTKTEEYRLITPYWTKRLEGRSYDRIELTLGYPKRDDAERRLVFPWNGLEKKLINHPLFGSISMHVYAIRLQQNSLYPA